MGGSCNRVEGFLSLISGRSGRKKEGEASRGHWKQGLRLKSASSEGGGTAQELAKIEVYSLPLLVPKKEKQGGKRRT